MATLEFGGKELAYMIQALRHYESKLQTDWGSDDESLAAEAGMDLIFIQALLKQVRIANGEE